MISRPYTFWPNEVDDIHCLQSVFRMVYEGLLGQKLTLEQAEKMTGFESGNSSWPFQAMVSALESGLTVRNIEKNFNAELFVRDYKTALLKQTTPELLEFIERTSNTSGLTELVKKTFEYENMHWEEREPTWEDIIYYAGQPETAVACNVNARALYGDREGWHGHLVLIVSADDDIVVLDDPGLPATSHAVVDRADFLNAWSRDPAIANLIIFSK